MKIIIAGGREFNDYDRLVLKVDNIIHNIDVNTIEIISGRCDRGVHTFTTSGGIKVYGADGLGERYAKELTIPVKPMPALWYKFGSAAGPIRNALMANYADALIAFWDGRSAGTSNMINVARAAGLKIRIINYRVYEKN